MQLWASGHNCSICKGIVHLNGMCNIQSVNAAGNDIQVCVKCYASKPASKFSVASKPPSNPPSKPPSKPVTPPSKAPWNGPTIIPESTSNIQCLKVIPSTNKAKVVRPCKHCGGTDHQKITSKKCKKYVPPQKKEVGNCNNNKNNQQGTFNRVINLICHSAGSMSSITNEKSKEREEDSSRSTDASGLLSLFSGKTLQRNRSSTISSISNVTAASSNSSAHTNSSSCSELPPEPLPPQPTMT